MVLGPISKKYLLSLLTIKYNSETMHKVQLPGRIEERLLGIFTTILEMGRPLALEREQENRRAAAASSPRSSSRPSTPEGLDMQRHHPHRNPMRVHLLRLRRLLRLSSMHAPSWQDQPPDVDTHSPGDEHALSPPGWGVDHQLAARRHIRPAAAPFFGWEAARARSSLDLAILRIFMKIGIKGDPDAVSRTSTITGSRLSICWKIQPWMNCSTTPT